MPATTTTQHTSDSRGDYETDTRWTANDDYSIAHLHPPARPNNAGLTRCLKVSEEKGLPDIMLSPLHGKFFALQCRLLGVKHVLEVGTLGGYSAIWFATENPGMKVTTIEFDPHHYEVSIENIKAAGVSDQIDVILGAGLDVLPEIYEDIKAGKKERVGFTFIDADKGNNYNYVEWAIKMSVPKACIVVDNVVAKGGMYDAESDDYLVLGGRDAVEKIGKDPRLDATVLQTVGDKLYDGFLFAVIKE